MKKIKRILEIEEDEIEKVILQSRIFALMSGIGIIAAVLNWTVFNSRNFMNIFAFVSGISYFGYYFKQYQKEKE